MIHGSGGFGAVFENVQLGHSPRVLCGFWGIVFAPQGLEIRSFAEVGLRIDSQLHFASYRRSILKALYERKLVNAVQIVFHAKFRQTGSLTTWHIESRANVMCVGVLCCGAIDHHTEGSQTIPKSGIKWVYNCGKQVHTF